LEVFDQPDNGQLEKYPRNLATWRASGFPLPPLSVALAQQRKVCRFCQIDAVPSPDKGPLILDYGKEYAHLKCLEEAHARRIAALR
jgi:hypothetical protein